MASIVEQIVRITTDGEETRAEVVGEIVRCENCKECETRHTANYLPFLFCMLNEHSVSHNAYCCWGRRKETEDE